MARRGSGDAVIIVGQLTDDRIGAVVSDEAVHDRREPSVGAWPTATATIRSSFVAPDLPVTLGHRGRHLGRVRHLEQLESGCWAVADLHDLPAGGPLYFSLEGRRGGPDGAVLSGLAVTERPAAVGLAPLGVHPRR